MSSVSSIGSELSNLYKAFQQASDPNASAAASTATAQAADPNATSAPAAASGQAHHHHHGAHGLRSQIETAVTDALKSSDGKTDPNKVVQDAIASVFAKIQQGSTAGSTTLSTAATSQTAGASSTDRQAFAQLLQSYGIDPQQFRQDMQSAMQSSNGGSVDFSKLFRSFPAGSGVDTTA